MEGKHCAPNKENRKYFDFCQYSDKRRNFV